MTRRCPLPLLPAAFLALLPALPPNAADAREPDRKGAVDASFGPRIADAVSDAAARLDAMPCALVLSDYVDSRTGLTLAENLAATGRTASEHVRSLRFQGSPRLRPWPGKQVFAYTTPSGSVVYLCREDLLRMQSHRRFVTAIVIHEVLHTLGLQGDFPSSVSITERVMERCF